MKPPSSSMHSGSSRSITSTPCSASQSWPPEKFARLADHHGADAELADRPLQYQHGDSVVTMTQSA